MSNIKIGIITPSYFPNIIGGSEISVQILAESLVKKGYQVTVLTFDGKLNSVEKINGVHVVRYKIITMQFLSLILLPYVVNVMRQWDKYVDIFHIYNVWPLPGAGLYKILGGKNQVIATLNNYFGFCPISQILGQCWTCHFLKRIQCTILGQHSLKAKLVSVPYACVYPLLTKLSVQADYYIALSNFVKRIYMQFGFSQGKVIIIPNFADSKLFHANMKKRSSAKSSIILYVGRLSEEKGVSTLLRAFSKVCQTRKNLLLFLVGNGPEMERYLELTKLLKIENKVTFFGHLNNNELHKVYSIADFMVHPGKWPEPFGRTLLEAMSFNVPLIVSNTGTPPEIVENAGLVFESGNVSDLVEKIILLLDNSELLKKMESNCSKVLRKYALSGVLDKIIGLYDRILKFDSSNIIESE